MCVENFSILGVNAAGLGRKLATFDFALKSTNAKIFFCTGGKTTKYW